MDGAPEHLALGSLLVVEPSGGGGFEARFGAFGGVAFGGDILGRAVLAAARTCEGREFHSLQACFLRPVQTGVALKVEVDRVQDGRRLARRRVRIVDGGKACFEMTTSFAPGGPGVAFQDARAPLVPPPEEVRSDAEAARAWGWTEWSEGHVEWRWVGDAWKPVEAHEPARWHAWVRPRAPLAGDPALHAAALGFLSDNLSHWSIARRLRRNLATSWLVSLDHAVWAHAPARWDDWWLIETISDVARGGRAFTRRRIYTRRGELVASVAQEAFVAD